MKEIQLTKGKVALVDDVDFERINQWKWQAFKNGNTFYGIRAVRIPGTLNKKKYYLMHRIILGIIDPKKSIDHKDCNGLNNQRGNLRLASKSQNSANSASRKGSSSKYIGVHWYKRDNKWKAEITKDYRNIHLGMFKNEEEAAAAYNKAAIELHGEFAKLNVVSL